MTAHYRVEGRVAVISLANPPVNVLSHETCCGIVDGLAQAVADKDVVAIVLTGEGKAFCGGADLREFGTVAATLEPTVWNMIDVLENTQKPVVAAIHSVCMGGGLELALACHYRVVAPNTLVAFPEVKLGLLPGAGGTQRMPRVLGVETALNMIVSGETFKSETLASIPGQKLFDRLAKTSDSLQTEALEIALSAAAEQSKGSPLPLIRNLPCNYENTDAYFKFFQNTISSMKLPSRAALECIQCVKAAIESKKFDDGIAIEKELFKGLLLTPEFRALRHLFLAERAASRISDVPSSTSVRPITKVGVVGAGLMGGGIAINFLNAGIPVTILELRQEAIDKGLAGIRKIYERQVKKGKLSQEKAEQRLALLTPTLNYEDLKDVDLVIEAVFEELSVKEEVFKSLDAVVREGAILASNTSTLDLNKIAEFTKRPQDVVGMHFFSPANVMKLLEVVRGEKTGKDVLATIMKLASKIKKTAVVSGVCDGFIGNRMVEELLRQSGFLLDEGASPQQIDKAMESFGMAMGPFRVADLAGNDIGWAIRRRRAVERPELKYSEISDRLCEMGRLGLKSGAGWYDYVTGSNQPLPSITVAEMIEVHRKKLGIVTRQISDEEIVQRIVFALVNEGTKILDEGIASKASDIDLVYVLGYGFPASRGGPMQYANEVGLFSVVNAMNLFQKNPHGDSNFWKPASGLLERLKTNQKLV